MPILNPFDTDAFTMQSLTASINILPNTYGRLRELGLFSDLGVRTRSILVEEYAGVLNLLPTKPVGSPGTVATRGRRTVRSLTIPHIPHDDTILPDEYQGIRAFGSESEFESYSSIMANHLQTARNKFAITWEHLRFGALKGLILDADGELLYNLYTEFGIQQKRIDFKLGTSTTDVQVKCFEVSRHIEDNLKGEVMSEIRVLVSQEFFDKLISHDLVKDAFKYHAAAQNTLGGDPRKSFSFGGLTFEEHRGQASDVEGNIRRFIAPGEGHAFPLGTMSTFKTFYAPADFLETANTLGLPLYAKQKVRDFERGVDLHFQSNPLPLCLRPALLVTVYSSN